MTTLTPEKPRQEVLPPFELRGGAVEMVQSREREVLIEGPAGTGKTMAICHWMHLLCLKYPSMRALMLRKTLTALTATALVTFQEKVVTPTEALDANPRFFGGSKNEAASFRYRNGSRIVVGGMDNPDKILSSEYDFIFVNEAVELSIEDWETLTSRLRNGVLKYPRLVGDCNPTHNKHWLLRRCEEGKTRRIRSHLQDNPAYFDRYGELTDAGEKYMQTLDALTGTRYQRFRLGLWVGVENAVYDNFDRFKHLAAIRTDTVYAEGAIGVDYGDVHPHAVVALGRTSAGRLVVRETWSGRNYDDLVSTVGRFRAEYGITRVRVDPMLKGWEKPENSPIRGKVNRADASPGSRKNRIELVYRLFGDNALTLDINGKGNDELADEIEAYHYVHRQTDLIDDLVVARIDDDRVAALEYAIEELEGVNRTEMPRSARFVLPKVQPPIRQADPHAWNRMV